MAGFMISARVFSTFVIILGNFIFTQTVVAIILLNIDHATEKFKAYLPNTLSLSYKRAVGPIYV